MPRTKEIGWFHVVVLVVIVSTSVGACDEPESGALLMVEGATISARLAELNPNWDITIQVEGEEEEISRSDYVLWGDYADEARSSQVLLADGTVLVGDLTRIGAESITIASRLWGELRLARPLVRACMMLPAADPLQRDRQWQLLQTQESADRVLLLNGDTIVGRFLPTLERDDGGLFGLVSIGIELSGNDQQTSVRMEEVRAITFPTPTAPASQPDCLLGFRDGSLVAASKLTQVEPDLTRISTAAGMPLELRTGDLQGNLTFIQPRNETVVYLSDLPAVGYKLLPFLALDWPLGIAANTLGGRLRSGGNVIFKGLGMHSASRVAFTLDGKYRRFEAELALDDHAQEQGSVVYRVLVERNDETGQRAWKLAYTSPILRGGDTARSVAVDVSEATRLALIVEIADRADIRDYANWLNARLLR